MKHGDDYILLFKRSDSSSKSRGTGSHPGELGKTA